MKYKGYTGVAEVDDEAGVIFGRVIGLRDTITFQGESVAEATQAFHDSVDDYLEFCESRGESPEKPFSGQFVLRIDPTLHRALSNAAELEGASLNSLAEKILKRAIAEPTGQSGPITGQKGKSDIRASGTVTKIVIKAKSKGASKATRIKALSDETTIKKIRDAHKAADASAKARKPSVK